MAEVASAYVSLIPSAKGFGSGISKEISGDVDKAGRQSGRTFGTVFAKAGVGPIKGLIGMVGGPLTGAFAAIAGISALGGFIQDARESAKIGRLTAQVIKSTGGAAKVTAGQVGDLATAISNKTGADDEAVQSGANMLLTFTNIRNEAGKGNDVFNQATQTVTDLSAALGQDTKSSAIQLGKALNDPIRGVTALQRVGVSFTESQKKQIETLVKSGDTLSAQKLILGELNKEFGGAAKAAADPLQRLGVITGNAAEAIGGALLPVVDSVATFLGQVIPPAVDAVSGAIGGLVKFIQPAVHAIEGVFAQVSDTVKLFIGTLTGAGADVGDLPWMNTVIDLASQVQATFSSLWSTITTQIVPAFMQIGTVVGQFVIAYVKQLYTTFTTSILPVLAQVWTIITTQVVPAFLGFVQAIVANVLPIVQQVAGFFTGTLMPAIASVYEVIAKNLVPIFQAVVQVVTTNVMPAVVGITAKFKEWWPTIQTVGGFIVSLIATLVKFVANILGVVIPAVLKIAGPVIGALITIIGTLIGWFVNLIGAGVKVAQGLAGAWDTVKTGVTAVKDFIVEKFNAVLSFFGDIPGKISSVASGMWDGLTSTFRAAVNVLIDAWNSLDFSINIDLPSWLGGYSFHTGDLIPDIPRLASGGVTTGSVLANIGEAGTEAVLPLTDGRAMRNIRDGLGMSGPVELSPKTIDALARSTGQRVLASIRQGA